MMLTARRVSGKAPYATMPWGDTTHAHDRMRTIACTVANSLEPACQSAPASGKTRRVWTRLEADSAAEDQPRDGYVGVDRVVLDEAIEL